MFCWFFFRLFFFTRHARFRGRSMRWGTYAYVYTLLQPNCTRSSTQIFNFLTSYGRVHTYVYTYIFIIFTVRNACISACAGVRRHDLSKTTGRGRIDRHSAIARHAYSCTHVLPPPVDIPAYLSVKYRNMRVCVYNNDLRENATIRRRTARTSHLAYPRPCALA